jgi:arylsulfatase A-like enzyme
MTLQALVRVVTLSALLVVLSAAGLRAADAPRPNVVWITCEDLSPIIGPYGDTFATTPNLDEFAAKSLRYKTCWSNAPVCAPARTTLITGTYATSLGAEHMRSQVPLPDQFGIFTQFLRGRGYYCTNNSKTDYNVVVDQIDLDGNGPLWDESSNKAHWKNRTQGTPFFEVFNTTVTHESGVHKRKKLIHDPAKVRVPAYQPDLPEIREDWAQYYDNVTLMDEFVGERLKELEDAGLTDDTIVWFFSDHGMGLPRCKRVPCNSGLRVPLIVHIPDKFKHLRPDDYMPGGMSDRLVSFVDFADTVKSLCLGDPQGSRSFAFLGPQAKPPREFLFGYRGRMDERVDMVRSVTDGRYVYVRNYMPGKSQGQYLSYMYKQAGIQAWKAEFDKGTLPPEQAAFFEPKPAEQLFDLKEDPDEVHNLIGKPSTEKIRDRLREALMIEYVAFSYDLGYLPEAELHRIAGNQPPAKLAFDQERYPLGTVHGAAENASISSPFAYDQCVRNLSSSIGAVRYWAVIGLTRQGQESVGKHHEKLVTLLDDEAPCVRIAAGELLCRFGKESDRAAALPVLMELSDPKKHGVPTAILALNSIDTLSPLPADVVAQLKANSELPEGTPQRMREYVPRLIERITENAKAR